MAYDMTMARRDPMSRLDAWVIEELEALSRPEKPQPRPHPQARQEPRPKRRREPVREAADFGDDGPLPMDENQFIQQVSEWLSGRPNADLILEEIWRNVVVPEADEARADAGGDIDDELDDAAHLAADNDAGVDLDAEAPEGPAGDAADARDPPQG